MKCTRCHTDFSATATISACPVCGAISGGAFETTIHQTPAPTNLIPFEDPSWDSKPLMALIETIRECIFSPARFFSKITSGQSKWRPILFSLAAGGVGAVASFCWRQFLPDPFLSLKESAFSESITADSLSSSLTSAPVLLLISILFLSMYFQLVLKVFKKSKAPFLMTFRVVCYSEAASLFMVLPVAGDMISLFFAIYLTLTGIKTVHSISRTRVAVMFLIAPILLIFLFLCILLFLVAVFGSLASGTLKDFFPF
ncbi:MAG TPA: YIP1 family protein [Chitinispirillaceae bacterium]|nr:YIP1 family protein [Chitinispirillaceae bacterium]